MEYTINFLLGFIGSLLASIIFLFYILRYLRPTIEISKLIAYYRDFNIEGENRYYFKFINKSIHSAFDVKIRVCELIRWPAGNGKMNEQRKDLNLRTSFLAHVPRYRKTNDNEDTFAPHAVVITCLDDLRPILEARDKCVEIQVILRHGLTGLAKVFHYEYSESTMVKPAMFDFGNQLTITA